MFKSVATQLNALVVTVVKVHVAITMVNFILT